MRLCMRIMLYYTYTVYKYDVCMNLKSAMLGPQNQNFNYITRSITLHKTSCTYIRS